MHLYVCLFPIRKLAPEESLAQINEVVVKYKRDGPIDIVAPSIVGFT